MNVDLVVVGAGLFGLTVARLAADSGRRVLIIEQREHPGGNAFAAFDAETGIEVHQYGAHIFHTSNERVWDFVTRFSPFDRYEHRVKTSYLDRVYSMPINLGTMCQVAGMRMSPHEARAWVRGHAAEITEEPQNLEEKAIFLVGRPLYESLIRGYTIKQWGRDPKELPPETITRLPIRYNFDDRYFSDTYQGLPTAGYANWIYAMLDHPYITIEYETLYHEYDFSRTMRSAPMVYTGPLDAYFNHAYGQLGWRSMMFKTTKLDVDDYQGCAVMNEADEVIQHTRTIEWKHFRPGLVSDKTIITREFSTESITEATGGGDPHYPVNSSEDRALLLRYRHQAHNERSRRNVYFGGRLGTYQYLDMHMAIASAMRMYDEIRFA